LKSLVNFILLSVGVGSAMLAYNVFGYDSVASKIRWIFRIGIIDC